MIYKDPGEVDVSDIMKDFSFGFKWNGEAVDMLTKGRHDPCVGVRATPIAEAMLAIVVLDHYLRHRGQNADVKPPVQSIT